ncbi:Cationic amino acid transporter 3 [Halotydeus destructor]|nr:Cationic amino acid transporter 3 [Halotydeus destructor]
MSGLSFSQKLIRKKVISADSSTSGQLKRCLTTLDLTALGVGSTLGLGVYVLAGQVAATKAGPAVVLSFAIAAIASIFAGLSYAEFAARVPKAGSAYVYSYTTVGEFIAFLIGWNLILEYVIGTASVARGFAGYMDHLTDNVISHWLMDSLPLRVPELSPYFDLFSFVVTVSVCTMLAFGVKESANFTSIFTAVNLYVVAYVIVCGMFAVKWVNWNLPADQVPCGAGSGGFAPYKFQGIMAGAATCFYGFVGFDIIASTGEEANDPQRSMPRAIVFSLSFVTVAYIAVAAISTLMFPYYGQNVQAPLAFIFDQVGWPVGKYVVAIGAICSLSAALLGALFPLPRILYAMATDGLIFRFIGEVNASTQTPIYATIISGTLAGIMAAMFNVSQLADMMSIGTLLAYTLVTVSVLILRYQEDHLQVGGTTPFVVRVDESQVLRSSPAGDVSIWRKLFNYEKVLTPSAETSRLSNMIISALGATIFAMNFLLVRYESHIFSGDWATCTTVAFLLCLVFIEGYALWRQPQTSLSLPFRVPWLPLIPLLSMFCNIYLMLQLSKPTWIRFSVWLLLGFAMYFGYGIRHSVGADRPLSNQERKVANGK